MEDTLITRPELELGKNSAYEHHYNPKKLFPIPRDEKRLEIGINSQNPSFFGFDLWNHYEVSWLNSKGKPMVGIAEIIYDCHSPCIIESKSMKLYFNTFNQSMFDSPEALEGIMQTDIAQAIEHPVEIRLFNLEDRSYLTQTQTFSGTHLDILDIECHDYIVNPSLLRTENEQIEETVYSHLLKSNCLVTHQPDWGSVQISYTGEKIHHESLLKYLISFRNHNEFHEQCIERIFIDIMTYCQPKTLTVYGRYSRRGGVDINPIRSTEKDIQIPKIRLIRQ